ncbi:MAG: hypothetical protein K8L97_06480 [Anaerolineae bacterium]|nr:hypothetical protein [Anaerolineae bacterium]
MSIKLVETVVCDGCGTPIDFDYHLHITPFNQKVVQKEVKQSPRRDFCSEACQSWWLAEYPNTGAWGPAWDEREWWCEQVGECADHIPVRTTHDEMPIVDVHAHFDDPEPLK